jgi:3-deoxy-D-manno-octulosonic-acid transferase
MRSWITAVAKRLPATLRLYRTLWGVSAPVTALALWRRLRRGKEIAARLPERRGKAAQERPPGPLVWIHAASVGEITSVFSLIERVRAQQIGVMVTTGTVTSAAIAAQRLPRSVIHQFIPVDSPRYMRRFLAHWQPDLALLVESDLWPNLIVECAARAVPIILVNGRLSERSFRKWRRFPRTIAALLERLDLCLARTPADAERFAALTAPRVVITGDLKFDVPAPPVPADRFKALTAAVGKRPVLGAASTHPGEEAVVIEAHRIMRAGTPNLLTVIAPRHPERGAGVAEIAAAAGFKPALRSRGQLPTPGVDIYIADTIGELGLLYRLAPSVFIGGSLIPHGGQNPIEAAKLGAAILHGPHVGNFTEIYGALDAARGASLVADAQALADLAQAWLRNPAARNAAAEAAHNTVMALGGALDRTLQTLDPYLMQLRFGQRVGRGGRFGRGHA